MSEIFTVESAALPPTSRVAGFQGTERISHAFEVAVWLLIPNADAEALDAEAVLLKPGALRVMHDDGSPRWSQSGVWASLELVHEVPGGDSLYKAVLAPTVWKLKLTRHNKVWVNKTVPFILEDVLKKAGLTGRYSLRLSGRYDPRPHVCQYRESDFDFIARWMEAQGIYFYFEESDAGDTLVLTDDKSRHGAFGGGHVRVLHETDEGDSGTEGFRAFTFRTAAASASVKVHDYDPLSPTNDPKDTEDAWALGYGALVRHQEETAVDVDDAKRLATLRAEQQRASQPLARGRGRVFDVKPGYKFTLEEHPRHALNREYLCVEVTHHGRLLPPGDALARFVPVHGHRVYSADVGAFPASVQYRAPFATPLPRVKGVEVGRVDGAQDSPYAQIDAHGSYRVKLLFDENTEHDAGAPSTWVRMTQPHGGNPEGQHFPLRKGTEVMVAFVAGNPDRPVIVGAIPNAETPSMVTESNHTQNVIHTGSNNRIEVEDQAGAQYVDVLTPPMHTFIHLGATHGAHDHNYITSTDGNGHIHTGGVMNVTVGGQKNEHVWGKVLEEYDQTQTTTVTAHVDETYHVDQVTTVALHCQETYNATQTTEVKGHTEETSTDQETTVSGLLDEHHGTQTVNVDRLLRTSCTDELFRTGMGTHSDGTLTWNVHAMAKIKAGTFLMTGPSFNMNTRTVRTITRNVEQKVTVTRNEFMPFKLEMGIVGFKMNGISNTSLGVKVDVLLGTAYELTGAKTELTGAKISLGQYAFEAYAMQREVSGLRLALFGALLFL